MKRPALLYVCFVLLSLLALVVTGASAAPPVPQPALEVKGGGEWSNVCSAENQFYVAVVSENVLRYTCANVVKVWSETCDKKAALGFTSDPNGSRGGAIRVTCGI